MKYSQFARDHWSLLFYRPRERLFSGRRSRMAMFRACSGEVGFPCFGFLVADISRHLAINSKKGRCLDALYSIFPFLCTGSFVLLYVFGIAFALVLCLFLHQLFGQEPLHLAYVQTILARFVSICEVPRIMPIHLLFRKFLRQGESG